MKKIILFLALLFISNINFAQVKKIVFDFDFATFGYDSSSCYVELYYSFNQNSLKAVKNDSGLNVEALMKIEIQDTVSKKFIVNKEWRVSNPIADSLELKTSKSLVGVISFVIPKGVYTCSVRGRDVNLPKSVSEYKEIIDIKNEYANKISLSDIELASNILQDNANKNSIFYKNSLEVTPLPTAVFGAAQPVVYYYTEIYNLKKDTAENDLKLIVTVLNSRKKTVLTKTKGIRRIKEARVEVGTLNATKLPSDTYTLVLSLYDSVNNTGVNSSKRFFVYNPNVVDTAMVKGMDKDLISSEFSVMSVEECDDLFNKCKYISFPVERTQYAKIQSVEGKRDFLYQFWKRRNPEPSSPRNDYYISYLARIQQSNEKYGSLAKTGLENRQGARFYKLWRTERY